MRVVQWGVTQGGLLDRHDDDIRVSGCQILSIVHYM